MSEQWFRCASLSFPARVASKNPMGLATFKDSDLVFAPSNVSGSKPINSYEAVHMGLLSGL